MSFDPEMFESNEVTMQYLHDIIDKHSVSMEELSRRLHKVETLLSRMIEHISQNQPNL
ncbi:hypothetical protein [Alicyclobacillus dauci]|uniref:Spo0E like sporulation regulatory protein n=1 Tax=Alicyclobacillus dauci TaxID=1475485 RepID=A0ABY6Z138_9BACL|nr:hypothetical protein [Alicyclobacillus dauci]WAH36044.1 hypothetical protein NZD86_17550 [Alicyclobacillus dauci]